MPYPTYTYSGDFATQRDKVRVEIGDTQFSPTNTLVLADEEIAYAGTVEGNDVSVAARCCEFMAAKFSQKADITEGKLSLKLSQRAKALTEKAVRLRALAAATGALPSVGGESVSEKNTNDLDTDRVPPAFWREMLDNPEAEPMTPSSDHAPEPFDQTS